MKYIWELWMIQSNMILFKHIIVSYGTATKICSGHIEA